MTATNPMRHGNRAIRRQTATHLFTVGQTVRLKSASGATLYRITATLPARDNSLQYRVRNEEERYERVTTEDGIELVNLSPAGEDGTLIERTFGHG